MARIITIHNISGTNKMYVGQSIPNATTYTLIDSDVSCFKMDSTLFTDVGLGVVLIGNGTDDFNDSAEGWAWLQGDEVKIQGLPFSNIDNKKLAVHPSYKPNVDGITTYAVWGGAGDEVDGNGVLVDGGEIGGGPMLHLACTTSVNEIEVTAKYHPDNGRIWLHEAYIKFADGPEGAYLSGGIIAMATPLQQVASLDLLITNNVISYSPGGPGTGTHGFADATKIVLIPRSFSHDGEWNYDGTNLTPAAGDGEYKMYDVDTLVHRFVNRISCCGTSPYFSITSDETTELPKHYYVRVCARTEDEQNFTADWHASVILEIYRERTYKF